jgi:tetratricopeptide (TPR) repeat protein
MFRHPLLPINAIVCLCLACLVSAGCFNRSSDLSTETWSDKNRAIALLENGAETDKKGSVLNESAEKFRNIAKQYPSERLGLQNLCIVLLSRLKLLDPVESSAEYESIGKEFEKSVASLKRITPTEPDADTLASRYYQLKNDRDAAVQSMRDATRTANARADTFFQLIELLRSEQTLEGSGEMLSILESALKLAPNNLILAVSYLDGLAKSHDSRFEAQAERCRELFRPIMTRTNSVISTLLDKGIAAAKGSDWKIAQTQLAYCDLRLPFKMIEIFWSRITWITSCSSFNRSSEHRVRK